MCTAPRPVAESVKKEPQLAETCPFCGEANLNYGDSGLQDTQYFYKWTCSDCAAEGTEWFTLIFTEHIITKPGTPVPAAA